jgi:hypothetical protein
MERVFLDANVLYPISVADLILRLGDAWLHEVLWSEDLLLEVERILTDRKGLPRSGAAYFCDCIRRAFPHGEIDRRAYAHLIGTRTGPDPDDHVHAAAAIAGEATVLLTSNVRDYPAHDLGDVRVETPDRYFVDLLTSHPDVVLAVLTDMGSQRRRPQPVEATLAALERAGLKRFAERATTLLGPVPVDPA